MIICSPGLVRILTFGFAVAIALWPVIIVSNKPSNDNHTSTWYLHIINHERIHLRQQLELLIIGFYVVYMVNYFINLGRYRNHVQAYREIVFEREAYAQQSDLTYLKTRKVFQWYSCINSV